MFSARRSLLMAFIAGLLPRGASSQLPPGPEGVEITLEGEIVCVNRLGAKDSQPADCRVGFRDDRDRYYSLRERWPQAERLSRMPINLRVRVTGRYIPGVIDGYEQVGLILATQIEPILAPKPVAGTYICLPHKNPGGPQLTICVPGIRTRRGLYWGLNLNSLDQGARQRLALGDTISIEAQILGLEPEEVRFYQSYPVEGVLKVLRLNKSEGRQRSTQPDAPPDPLPRQFPKPTTRGLP